MFSINLKSPKFLCWASQVVLVLKTLPTNAGYIGNMGLTLGWEDHLEKGMAAYSSLLA